MKYYGLTVWYSGRECYSGLGIGAGPRVVSPGSVIGFVI